MKPDSRMRRYGVMTRDKEGTLLLLLSALLVMLPHTLHLPLWVSGLCLLTLCWRALITLGGRRMPPSWLVLPLAALAMGGVMQTFHTLLGKDAGVAMLIMLIAFKTLEMHARRDLFVVVFLCFFLALTNFFYSQSVWTGLFTVAAVLALLTTELSFQYGASVPPLGRRVRNAAAILALAAPVALVLFLGFPRVQGPLWGVPENGHGGQTGLSEDMTPGNFSALAQSEAVVFRARFPNNPPAQSALYWRAVVLGDFDGRTWRRAAPAPVRAGAGMLRARGAALSYEITLEPLDTRWLYALDMPAGLPDLGGNVAQLSPEGELAAAAPVDQRLRYRIASYLHYAYAGADSLPDAARWLRLPAGRNPRALAAGQALQAEADPLARVNAVLRRFHDEQFSYTLEPPLLGADPVDEFLFQTRSGFCEHYASAFVVLMRAAGLPARVVTGYQGGQTNPVDGYLTVRQSDAHAWAEVWLGQRGWVRFDPTAAVAPERIRRSLARALPAHAPFGLDRLDDLLGLSDDQSWLGQLRFRFSAINNGWNQWVLNYTPQRQRALASTLTDDLFSPRNGALLVLALALLWSAHILRRRARTDPVDTLYSALCHRMAQLGLPRAPYEGPSAYAARLAQANLGPVRQSAIVEFLHHYSHYRYGPASNTPGLVATLKNLLAQCR